MKQVVQNLTAIRAFHAMAQGGGITAAAASLNVTPGAIRHQIRLLEQELGQSLFVRSKRNLLLTPAGCRLHDTVGRALSDIAAACRALAPHDMRGELRVACAPAFAALRMMRVIDVFARSYPLMSIRLFPIEHADETIDVIVTYGEMDLPGTRVAILREETYFPVCSPALANRSDIARPDDLTNLVGLHARDHVDWTRLLGAASRRPLGFRQEIVFPDAHLSIQAAREGCGVAVGTSILCADDFRRGSLIRLLDCEVPAPCPYFVIRPQGRGQRAAELFTSILVQEVEALSSSP